MSSEGWTCIYRFIPFLMGYKKKQKKLEKIEHGTVSGSWHFKVFRLVSGIFDPEDAISHNTYYIPFNSVFHGLHESVTRIVLF
jgi:hypothetical protein